MLDSPFRTTRENTEKRWLDRIRLQNSVADVVSVMKQAEAAIGPEWCERVYDACDRQVEVIKQRR